MTSFFNVGGNPFATPVGLKIERATSDNLPSEDWGLNMEICDLINQTEEGSKDAMKAIRKRLTAQPKNYTVVLYTLTVLETCVKNCGKKFHVLACSKDFIQELVKLIGPKNDPPAAIQEKVLSLIQAWAEAFRHQPELSGVSQVFAELKHKKVEFPPPNPDLLAPIFTPQRSVEVQSSIDHPPPEYERDPPIVPLPQSLSSDQKAKLHDELDLVESNAKVLAEMLNELSPGKEQHEDLQLLKDLHGTCQAMQERVVELVGRVDDDFLTADLLRINDELNNLFVRYDRHMSKTRVVAPAPDLVPVVVPDVVAPVPAPIVNTQKEPKVEVYDDAPLIDLGGEESAIEELSTLCIGTKPEDADFDVFAQSRTTTIDEKPIDLLCSDVESLAVQDQKSSDFAEMEQWLTSQASNGSANPPPRIPEESVSSSEFDKFLAERAAVADTLPTISAAVADTLPTINAATGSSSMGPSTMVPSPARSRTITKEDQTQPQLFSL